MAARARPPLLNLVTAVGVAALAALAVPVVLASSDPAVSFVLAAALLATLLIVRAGRRRPPAALLAILGLAALSGLELVVRSLTNDPHLALALRLEPSAVAPSGWYRLLSVALVHNDASHLALNLLPLIVAVPLVAEIIGLRATLAVIVLATLDSSLVHLAVGGGPAVGASPLRYAYAVLLPAALALMAGRIAAPRQAGLLGLAAVVVVALSALGQGLLRELAAHQTGFAVGALMAGLMCLAKWRSLGPSPAVAHPKLEQRDKH